MKSPVRQAEWINSRRAQRVVLGALGMPGDTSRYRYPHPRLSLSHTPAGSVAAGVIGPLPAALTGIGVDCEPDRPTTLDSARFFLDERERAWLRTVPERSQAREQMRLWTVKEALLKSDPAQKSLIDYRTEDPARISGSARRAVGGNLNFVYSSGRLGRAHLTVAASFRRTSEPRSTMTNSTVSFQQVAEQISETLSVSADTLTPETKLRDLGADSFMLVEMVVDLQERFDAVFTQAQLREISTLGELVGLLGDPR